MTALQQAHSEAMAQGRSWMAAATAVSRRYNLDIDTVVRMLRAAAYNDRREGRAA